MQKYKFSDRHSARMVKAVLPLVRSVRHYWDTYKEKSDEELAALTPHFKARVASGESLDAILPEAFAAACEASSRVLHMAPYDEQIIGGIFLHQGRIAELRTGEGKTLVAVLPAYLNALSGEGVHVVTVNDYLAQRDMEQMSAVYGFLGLLTGLVTTHTPQNCRKEEYDKDITYITNSELGFDFLRDNMALRADRMVQRKLSYCIIDEVDSILIDEARTPLIISAPGSIPASFYEKADLFASSLKQGSGLTSHNANKLDFMEADALREDGDYNIDEKDNIAVLTESGIAKAERYFHIQNYADRENIALQHAITVAIKARVLMERDKDYLVRDGEVLIIDEFTGRVMDGRRFNDGLHQALEAKEHVEIHPEDDTLATITYQSFFNKYKKKSGMTGTAMTELREFREIYHMECVCVPTHRPIQRVDEHDIVYATRSEKFQAVADRVRALYKTGQPVLVGTATVDDSEYLSSLLPDIPHEVLNARQDAHEAEIVAKAGRYKAVTIATNMAGRGTDIKLDEAAKNAGGLYVIGTQRHESRRVDNQLRGRSGRQGDPGRSTFYLSLEDDLLRLFGSDSIAKLMKAAHVKEGTPISHKALSGTIRKAQLRVEANNYSIRKNLVDYDSVVDVQRTLVYNLRDELMRSGWMKHAAMDAMRGIVIWYQIDSKGNREKFIDNLGRFFVLNEKDKEKIRKADEKKFVSIVEDLVYDKYDEFEKHIGFDYMRDMERTIILKTIDKHWVEHLQSMDKLKQAVYLQAYAQKDPVVQFRIEGFRMCDEMLEAIREDIVKSLFAVIPPERQIHGVDARAQRLGFEITI